MNKLKMSISVGLLTAAGAIAQQYGPPPPMGMAGGPMGPGHFGAGPHQLVTGVPYSADASSQSVQTLADGNTISRTTTSHIARDSQGRTYTQETIAGGFMGSNGPATFTFISDPVGGFMYRLNTATKVATRTALRVPPASPNGSRPQGPRPFGPGHDAADTQTADLGTQVINGVSAQGKNVTRTVPAGAMGNAQPIVSTSEVWYSPDLQIVVQAKHNDPRMRQSTYSLTNIQRAEPAASLFQVPSDYTVQDGKLGPDHGPMHQ